MFETGAVPANGCYLCQVSRHKRDMFSIFSRMKVYCVFSLELPHPGNSSEYKQYTIFNIEKKIPEIIPNLQLWDFFQGTQE